MARTRAREQRDLSSIMCKDEQRGTSERPMFWSVLVPSWLFVIHHWFRGVLLSLDAAGDEGSAAATTVKLEVVADVGARVIVEGMLSARRGPSGEVLMRGRGGHAHATVVNASILSREFAQARENYFAGLHSFSEDLEEYPAFLC